MTTSDIDLPLSARVRGERPDTLGLVSLCSDLAAIRTVTCGQSHNAVLARALVEPLENGSPSRANALGLELGFASLLRPIKDDDYPKMVEQVCRERNVVLVWNGNQANADFLMTPGRPFDLVPRGYGTTSVVAGAQIVPETMLRAHFTPSLQQLGQMLKALGRPPGLKRIVLGVQPPLQGETILRERMRKRSGYFHERARQMGIDAASVPIAAASVRHKLWFVLMGMYREMAESHGALFVPCPSDAIGPDGYLKPELTGIDGTHGNIDYGRMVIEHLVPHLREAHAS
jgi:hypothetical protein